MISQKPEGKISAVFEFTGTGYLKGIFLNAENDGDQKNLERFLLRLLKPNHQSWTKRLMKGGRNA